MSLLLGQEFAFIHDSILSARPKRPSINARAPSQSTDPQTLIMPHPRSDIYRLPDGFLAINSLILHRNPEGSGADVIIHILQAQRG